MADKEDDALNAMPEEIQLAIKLEEIFTPQFRKTREERFKDQHGALTFQNETRFVHYTTAAAAIEIIRKKHIWMRQTSCMSDYSEVMHGIDILSNCFNDDSNLFAKFKELLDACSPGAVTEAIDMFKGHNYNIKYNTYIASISEHVDDEDQHGRLSMWRAYGGNSGRVALIFKIPWFTQGIHDAKEALNIQFSPIEYLKADDYIAEFNQIIENIKKNRDFLSSVGHKKLVGGIFSMLFIGALCLKHYGFREEKEWRIIYSPNLWQSSLMRHEIKVLNGVPQKVYELPLDKTLSPVLADLDISRIFDQLIIGPTDYPIAMYDAFKEELDKIGIQEIANRIKISGIPIRT